MGKKLPFRSLSPTTWRLAGSAALVALFAYLLALRSLGEGGAYFGFGSFLLLTLALYVLAFQFSEWRRVKHSLLALALTLGVLFSRLPAQAGEFSLFSPAAAALAAGALAALLFVASVPRSDPRRTAQRVFGVALTFLAAALFFTTPASPAFIVFAAVAALLTRDEVKGLQALRVGSGALIGAAVGLLGAEVAAFVGLLPLGPVRAAALTALALFLAREGLAEAYQGGLRRELVFQGLAIFFILSAAIFSSVAWTL